MQKYNVPYRLLAGLFAPGARSLLLQVAAFREKSNLPNETIIHIASYVACLSDRDTLKLFNAIHLQLLNDMLKVNVDKFTQGILTVKQRKHADNKAMKRHKQRISFA
jgi:hypothetical protein